MCMQEVSSHDSSLFLTLFFFLTPVSLSGNDMMSALILCPHPYFVHARLHFASTPSVRSVFFLPEKKPGTQNAPHVFASLFRAQWLEPSLTASLSPHASQSFGIGCSFGFGRSMPSASSSLASFSISYACAYFVHNLYTKTNTATNRVSNLHPRCLYAGTQNTAKKIKEIYIST